MATDDQINEDFAIDAILNEKEFDWKPVILAEADCD